MNEGIKMVINFIRLGDDELERSAISLNDTGGVTLSLDQYKRIMVDAGWKQR